jgi:predicted metal-dependent phosphoesterase TrpH
MHIHTCGSYDCLSDPEDVLRAAHGAGLDMVCITDHNEIERALALRERYPAHVVVGEEVKTAEGVDVIGLFLAERIPKGTPARETCAAIHAQGGIVYMPHPFAPGRARGGRLLDAIGDVVDAVEGFNGRMHVAQLNERAVRWGRANGKAIGAGSDAHTLREVGRGFVDMPAFDGSAAGFLASLRQGTLHGRLSSWGVHLASTWAKLRSRLGPR